MLAVGTWLLLVATSLVSVVYFLKVTLSRKRRPGEPEIPKGSLLLGNASDFGTHAVDFLHKCEKEHGKCFTMRLINQYVTIIADPHSYEALSREKNFDFDPIQKQVNWNVFSFVLKEPATMIKDTAKTVRGTQMTRAVDNYVNNLNDSCDNFQMDKGVSESSEWQSAKLRQFASDTIFNAIFNTIFGKSDHDAFNSKMVCKNFDIFHKYFNFFWLGLPKSLFPAAMRALQELLVMPESSELTARDDVSEYLKSSINFMKGQNQTESDIKGHNLVYLHVNYNTYRLSFWSLYNLLANPKAYAHLQQEVDEVIYENLDPDTNTATFNMKQVESLKVLDSFINETMRLASGVFMVRGVVEDTYFTTSDGVQHLIRKGDRVAMYPPAIHKDPEIFEDPLEFKYDRFVDTVFYKDGKVLKNPVNAFGSLCPGRRLATMQLKWFVLGCLSRFDMRLQDGEVAEYAYEYHGHEVLPPKQDVNFDLRLRDNHPTLKFSQE